jgi:hypothetical protein
MADWKSATLQLGEWMPDQSAYGNEDPNSTDGTGLDVALNALYMFDNWKEVRGRRVLFQHNFGAGSSFQVGAFCDFEGTIYAPSSESRLYAFNETVYGSSTGCTFADYSKGGSAYPQIVGAVAPANAATANNAPPGWCFTIFGANVIAAQSGTATSPSKMQYRPMGGGAFADLVVSSDEPRWALIGTCKSFLVGANLQVGGSGAYSLFNGQEFGWSAINDPTNWTPDTTGTTQCGFAFLADEDGANITGLVVFPEFFLLFKDNSVTQVTYQGGALVWNVQVVASGAFGLGAGGWAKGLVRSGRDCYYWSKAGPAVVIGGQYVQLVGEGKWRRYICDQIQALSGTQNYNVEGCYIPDYHQVAWLITAAGQVANGEPSQFLVIYDIASYRLTSYQKGNEVGRGSLVSLPVTPTFGQANGTQVVAVCTQRNGLSTSALDRVRMIESGVQSGFQTLSLTAFTDPASSLPITLRTKVWHPSPDHLCLIQKVRLVWKMDGTRAGLNARPVYPTAVLTMEFSNDPLFAGTAAYDGINYTLASNVQVALNAPDENGFVVAAELNVVAGFFRFTLSIPSFSNAQALRQLSAIEVLYVEDQVVY